MRDTLKTHGSQNVLVKTVANSKLLARGCFLLAVGFLAYFLLTVIPFQLARTDKQRDVPVYYHAANNLYHGESAYEEIPHFGPDQYPTGAFLYAPPVAALYAPFGGMSFVAFAQLVTVVNMLAFLVFVWALLRLIAPVTLHRSVIFTAVLWLFPGVMAGIFFGQIDPLLWMLFALGLLGTESLFWPLAAIVKPFYLWPLLTRKLRRDDIIRVIMIIGAAVIAGGIVCGWSAYPFWFTHVLPTMSQGNFLRGNVSLSFAVLRAFLAVGIWHYDGGPLTLLPHLWLTFASIGAPIFTWWLLRRQEQRLKAAAVMTAAALFAPVCWITYLPVTLPLLMLLWRRLSNKCETPNVQNKDCFLQCS